MTLSAPSVTAARRRPRSQRVVAGNGTPRLVASTATTLPRDAQIASSGQRSQLGARRVHVAVARSITASSQRPGRLARDEVVGRLLQPGPARRHAEHPRHDPSGVHVERRDRHVEGRRGHGARRVRTHPRQTLQGLDRPGHAAAVIRDDRAGGFSQGKGTPVVAQPGPGRQEFVGAGRREIGWRRPTLDEPTPGRADSLDPGLLGHDLGDQDLPRRRCLPDREGAAAGVVPAKQPAVEAQPGRGLPRDRARHERQDRRADGR